MLKRRTAEGTRQTAQGTFGHNAELMEDPKDDRADARRSHSVSLALQAGVLLVIGILQQVSWDMSSLKVLKLIGFITL